MARSHWSVLIRRRLSHCFSIPRLALASLLVFGGTQPLWAIFTVVSNGVVITLPTGSSPLGTPSGIAVDLVGNVYIADTTNNQIIKVSPDGVTTSALSITGLSPVLNAPTALALDSTGNLYIADTGNSRIVEVEPGGSASVVATPTVTLNAPQGVAVDGSGNIYIADTGNNRIVMAPAGGGNASTDLAGSLAGPRGIAVDPLGNLYVADTGNSRIIKVNATSPFASGSINATVTTAAGVALNAPSSVFSGSNGILYIADTNTTEYGNSGTGRIVIVDSQGNASQLLNDAPVFNAPLGLSVDAMGKIYVIDSGGSSNAGRVQTFQSYTVDTSDTFTSSVNFGHVQLGSAGTSITIPFAVSEVSTLTSINAYTSGTQNLDFTIANDTTCAPAANLTTCTVDVTFSPTAAGLRKGMLLVNYTSSDGLPSGPLSIPIFGYADAPVAALSPGVASVFNVGSTAVAEPFQSAVDGAGNIYVTSYSGNHVIAIPAGGGSGTTVNTGSIALAQPTGVALDAAGNIFIADYANSRIVEVPVTGTASVFAISGLSQYISYPTTLAFDAAGNLYIADYGGGQHGSRIVEVNPYGQGTVVATGSFTFNSLSIAGTSVDALGNVFIPDHNNNRIVKVDPRGYASLLSLPSLTLSGPWGVAADPNGNVYIMDSGHQRIIQQTSSGATSVMSFSGVTIGSTIFGITPDSNGNILVGDFISNRLVRINVGQSALTFPNTNTNASSATKTATVTDLGDQPLVFSAAPTFTNNFPQDTNDSNPCTSSTSLSSGTSCDVAIVFSPQTAGSLSANIAVTNNTLNVAGSTQQIAVSGTGINAGDTTATTLTLPPAASAYSYGQPITVSATITDTTTGHTASIPTGAVTFIDTVGSTVTQLNSGSAVTLSGTGTAILSNAVLTGIGSHSITASYAGVSQTYLPSSGTTTISLNKSAVTVTGLTATITLVPGQAGTAAITITPPFTGGNMPTGTVTYTIVNAATVTVASGTAALTAGSGSSSATVPIVGTLPPGTYTLAVTYSGDTNYQSPPVTTMSVTVAQNTPVIAWTPPASAIYGANLSSFLTATASFGGNTVPGTFTYTATPSGGAPTAVTAATVLAAGSYTLRTTFTPTDSVTYTSATRSVFLTIGAATPSVALVTSATPIILTSPFTLTASVASSAGTPTGSIRFYDGTTLLATVTLSNLQATLTTSSLAAGTHSITAVYSGDANFSSTTSAAVAELVQDFTISSPSSSTSSATATPGGTATYNLNIGPTVGTVFPAPITLSLSGLPPGATGTLTPTTLPAGSGLSAVTLSIQLPQIASAQGDPMHTAPLLVGLVLLPLAGRWRRAGRRLGRVAMLSLVFAVSVSSLIGLVGCSPHNGFFAQPQQTYTIQVIATSGSLSHSTSVTLTVE